MQKIKGNSYLVSITVDWVYCVGGKWLVQGSITSTLYGDANPFVEAVELWLSRQEAQGLGLALGTSGVVIQVIATYHGTEEGPDCPYDVFVLGVDGPGSYELGN